MHATMIMLGMKKLENVDNALFLVMDVLNKLSEDVLIAILDTIITMGSAKSTVHLASV